MAGSQEFIQLRHRKTEEADTIEGINDDRNGLKIAFHEQLLSRNFMTKSLLSYFLNAIVAVRKTKKNRFNSFTETTISVIF